MLKCCVECCDNDSFIRVRLFFVKRGDVVEKLFFVDFDYVVIVCYVIDIF